MSAERWFNQVWYEQARPPWWLKPLSLAYGAVVSTRRFAYRHLRRARRLDRPVVIVGNLSVGGTGKTPLVCWLALALRARGYHPGIVTRGYGGRAREPRRVAPDADPLEVGDEAVLLARRTRLPVAIARERASAAELLVAAGCDVIVSDDGLQHYALARDCEIIVIDGDRRFGNGWLLPAGPLREGRARLASADLIVVNGAREVIEGALGMRLDADHAIALRDHRERPLRAFAGTRVHAVAGIGHPERFFSMLRAHGIEVDGHPHPDHARFEAADIRFEDDAAVLMTEKDAVKCERMADHRHWFVPVGARFEEREADLLLTTLLERIGRPRG